MKQEQAWLPKTFFRERRETLCAIAVGDERPCLEVSDCPGVTMTLESPMTDEVWVALPGC